MKILHVIDQLNAGGAERVCIDLANISYQSGLSIGILVLLNESKLDSAVEEGVSLYYLRRESKLNIKKYYEVAAICKNYDIIHIHMRHVYRYMAVVKLIANIKAKLILHDHFGDIHTQRQVPFLFNSLFKPRYYIGVSKELTNWAVQYLKMDEQKVFLLANIVRQVKVKSNLSVTRDIVVVSNIRRTKNIGFAIQIAAALNLEMDIIGQLADQSYYEELNEIIQVNKVKENIRFIHNCYDVQARLGNYRIALHTASSETGPLVLMEYLAQGTNFLAYRTGEVAEALGHILPDFFMDTFDFELWKERILQRMENPVDKATLLAIFQQNFSAKKY